MNYLVGYLILGLLFVVPVVWNAKKGRGKMALFLIFTLPLWIFYFALLIFTLIRMNRYSSRCVFCGEKFEATGVKERDQAIREHIRKCEKHPFHAELEGWRAKNRTLAKRYANMEMKYLTALKREEELMASLSRYPGLENLIREGEPILVIPSGEPYFMQVYRIIRDQKLMSGYWTPDDEITFMDLKKGLK